VGAGGAGGGSHFRCVARAAVTAELEVKYVPETAQPAPGSILRTGPGRAEALKRHSRFPMEILFVWRLCITVRRALDSQKRRFPAPRAAACLVHDLLTIAKCY
jgi:hypothetical protein